MNNDTDTQDQTEAWEDIMDELGEHDSVTRVEIGSELSAYDMNTQENMQLAIQKLTELGVKVK